MHKLIFQSVRGCTSSSKPNNEMLSSYKVDFAEVLANLVTHSVSRHQVNFSPKFTLTRATI